MANTGAQEERGGQNPRLWKSHTDQGLEEGAGTKWLDRRDSWDTSWPLW